MRCDAENKSPRDKEVKKSAMSEKGKQLTKVAWL